MPKKGVIGIGMFIQPVGTHFVKAYGLPFGPMVRRSFRIGLRLGLLFGVGFALAKTVQSRRAANRVPPPAPWEPIVDTPRAAPAAAARPAPVATPPAPVAPVTDAPVTDEVGEPIPAAATDSGIDAGIDPALDVVPPKPAAARKAPTKSTSAKKAARRTPKRGFVEPNDGACPKTHPVKAKLSSKIFHLPGMFAYDRTNADRCYSDGAAAEDDGFRAAKR